jgi:hypothetical protein
MATKHLGLLLIVTILGIVFVPECASDPDQPGTSQAADASDSARTVEVASPRFGARLAEPEREPASQPAAEAEREPTPEPQPQPQPQQPSGVLDTRDIVAYYGHPSSAGMGILGEYPIEENARRLRELSARYDELNGTRGVIPGFHIIYATATVDADVRILPREILMEYIRFAEKHDFAVILDHQLGAHDVVSSVATMFEYLEYDSVHLAFDPEWSTDRPNEVIGSVTAAEINEIQRRMQQYMIDNDIDGKKMLLVHQFNWRMIQNREDVRSDFERVDLVHNADGFGPPKDKYASWEYNVAAENMPLKGFKLFYPKEWRDGGYDDPLMTPEQVVDLEPQPVVIMYQ